jgi:hypothetical protein
MAIPKAPGSSRPPIPGANNGANNLFGPGMFTTDASLRKTFSLYEELKLAVEADVRNVFNHVNLQNPNSCIDCSNGARSPTLSVALTPHWEACASSNLARTLPSSQS